MSLLHPLDVYETAVEDHENPEDALGTLVHYMEDLAVETVPLPWGEWFEREDKAELEQLCKRVLQNFYHSDELAPFWVSLGYWARKSLLEKSVVQMVYKDGAKMPEQTWHALVDNHGKDTVLELVDAVSALAAKDSMPFLDSSLIKSGPLIALPLRLGMMHNPELAQTYGLHGHSMGFWAKLVAAGGPQSWKTFCTMYPWESPGLVHTILKTVNLSEVRYEFLKDWAQRYPEQHQALQAFMEATESPQLFRLPSEGRLDKATVDVRQSLLNGLYPSTPTLSTYIEQYRSLFGGVAPTLSLALPELNLD